MHGLSGGSYIIKGMCEDFKGVLGLLLAKPPCDSPHLLVVILVSVNECGGEVHPIANGDLKMRDMAVIVNEVMGDRAKFKLEFILPFLHGCFKLVFSMIDVGVHCGLVGFPCDFSQLNSSDETCDDLSKGMIVAG